MKVNIFISIIKSISAWLHGEQSRHFRTYTYPRIKRFTRQFINLGIYEYIERFYKVVDDTFYQGEIDTVVQKTTEVLAKQRLAEEIEGQVVAASTVLPRLSDIKDRLTLWKSLEQGNTYRCGTYTMNNMLRTLMLNMGLQPPLEVTAIDPLYIATKAGPGREGTIMDNAFAYLHQHGYPMVSWTPLMSDHNKQLAALESSPTIKNALEFSGIRTTGRVQKATSFEDAVSLDSTLPSNWQIQVSVNFCPSLQYFGQLVPFVKKVNGVYSFARTGGHSIHGVRGSFSTWEDGEAGMVIIESAYRASEDGWRFLKSKLFAYGLVSIRFVEFDVEGTTPESTIPEPVGLLATTNIEYGETSEAVIELQHYLIATGHDIAAGATGYFGEQTRTALKEWQDAQFGPKYDGKYWGPISQARYVELHS